MPGSLSPLVSTVIVTRDRPALLPNAVKSALGQTYEPLEIVVVDDYSTPPVNLRDVEDPRLRVIRLSRPSGEAVARNVGVAEAKGELIAFLDDDDVWLPNHVRGLVSGIAQCDSNVGIIESGHEGWRDGKLEYRRLPNARKTRVTLLKEPRILPSATLIRRGVFDRTGEFDPTFPRGTDWNFFVRASDKFDFAAVDSFSVRRGILEVTVTAEDRLRMYRSMMSTIRPRIRKLPLLQQLEVHRWLLTRGAIRRIHVVAARTIGESAWTKIGRARASVYGVMRGLAGKDRLRQGW